MPKVAQPHRTGYKFEIAYYTKVSSVPPSHGCGPRCRVDYNPNDDGPWTTLHIMDVRHDKVEDYTCAMPRYYAIPLILINKTLAYVEAQCRPDGTPLTGPKGQKVRLRDLRDYSYLWRLRQSFLKAIFEMNHDSRLNAQWRFERVHGFLYRLYRRFGHDPAQRLLYHKEEIVQGRKPYTEPDIAEMGEFLPVPAILLPLPLPHFPFPLFLSITQYHDTRVLFVFMSADGDGAISSNISILYCHFWVSFDTHVVPPPLSSF